MLHFLFCLCQTRIYLLTNETKQRLLSLCPQCLRLLFVEMHVCQLADQTLCLFLQARHPLAPGETIRIQCLCLSQQRIYGCPLLLSQQLTDRGDVPIRQTKKSQYFMDERFPLRHLS